MSSREGGRRFYDAGRKCRPEQSNGEDSATGRSGSSRDLNPTPDLSALTVPLLLVANTVVAEIDAAATKFVKDHLARFAVEIKNTTGATRDSYRLVQEQTSDRESLTIDMRTNERAATRDGTGEDLPAFAGHIYSDSDGKFPAKLNDWESRVIATETARPSFVAWYRNPQRATPNSLRIAYQDESEHWKSMQVDFIVISQATGRDTRRFYR